MSNAKEIQRRFWAKVNKTDGCWLWIACKATCGYGRFNFRGRINNAHRVSWIITNGEIPNGLWVLHKCDVRLCVNPNHLYLGTAKDNAHDKELRNPPLKYRATMFGETHPGAKLTECNVKEIRSLYPLMTQRALAERFGVRRGTIVSVLRRENWSHIA